MIKEWFNKYKTQIINALIICGLVILCSYSITQCYKHKEMNENNVIALTDSIHYYKDKCGDIVAYTTILEGDIKILKYTNDSLYNKIKSMDIPGTVEHIVYVDNIVELPKHDTIWRVQEQEKTNVNRNFAFNDEYHSLEGNISYINDTLGLSISNNKVYFDYTIGVNNKNQVYISSNNPYVKYNELSGLTVNKNKTKKFNFGPYIGYGYDISNSKFGVEVGIGLQYSLFGF